MRKKISITLDETVLKKLRETAKETGLPTSRQLENAWKARGENK